jgi:hypothetical protein
VEDIATANVLEEIKGNYPMPNVYEEAYVNVLDEISQSCSHHKNCKIECFKVRSQHRHHESIYPKMVRLFSNICSYKYAARLGSVAILVGFFLSFRN